MVEKTHTGGLWPALYDPFRAMGARLAEWLAPASEAASDEKAYRIALELPGVEEKDIALTVENGVVQVKGEKRESREDKGETWYFSERQYGSFSRSFRLPPDADEAAVSAALKDGVLTVTVPRRTPAQPGGKTVPIARG
jgi:HSP20 family protein